MYTNSLVGSVMTYVFSTKLNDAAWFGLYKTSNFAAFSAVSMHIHTYIQ